jgi:hypothetical protein
VNLDSTTGNWDYTSKYPDNIGDIWMEMFRESQKESNQKASEL